MYAMWLSLDKQRRDDYKKGDCGVHSRRFLVSHGYQFWVCLQSVPTCTSSFESFGGSKYCSNVFCLWGGVSCRRWIHIWSYERWPLTTFFNIISWALVLSLNPMTGRLYGITTLSLNIKLELSLTPASYMLITGAMNHLARILACEWAQDNIRTNSVTPWFVATPLTESVRTILFTMTLYVIYMNAVSFFLLIS